MKQNLSNIITIIKDTHALCPGVFCNLMISVSMLDYISQVNNCFFLNSGKTAMSTFGLAETIMYAICFFKYFAEDIVIYRCLIIINKFKNPTAACYCVVSATDNSPS